MQNETMHLNETGKIQPLVAIRALRALFKNKEDTGQVFKIVTALTGNSMVKIMHRFRADPVGHQVLAENRNLVATLCDRNYLRSLPEGSYGRVYLQFLETEGLTAEGLIDASNEAPQRQDRRAEFDLLTSRLRDSHDLQHVLTGYGRDTLGELSVLAFSYAHTRNRGIGFLVAMGMFKFKKDLPLDIPVFTSVFEAFRNGRKSAWFPAVDWEAMLKLPLDEVRHKLNIITPAIYKGVEARMIKLEAEYQRKQTEGVPQAA
ncbi:MAG: Coq4 family protein [Alphaproteobacteria bacterium]